MAAQPLPAFCDNCGTAFPSPIALADGGTGTIQSVTVGPCPRCGGTGSIPDGLYEFVDGTLNIASTWDAGRLRLLIGALQSAQQAQDPRAATKAVLENDEGLAELAKRFLVPKTAGDVYMLVSILLAALTLLLAASERHDGTVVNSRTVIEHLTVNERRPLTAYPQSRRDIPKDKPRKRSKKGR